MLVNLFKIKIVLLRLREASDANGGRHNCGVVGKSLVKLFRNVGHRRVQKFECLIEADVECVEGCSLTGLVLRLHHGLYSFEVDVRKFLLPKIVETCNQITELIVDKILVGVLD